MSEPIAPIMSKDGLDGPERAIYEMDRRRESTPWWRRRSLAYAACAVGLLAALAAADRWLRQGAAEMVVDNDATAVVQRGPLTVTVRGVGVLEPMDARVVVANASAVVGEVLVQPGTEVQAGDALVQLVDQFSHRQARQAASALAEAQASHRVLLAQFQDRKLAAEAALAQAAATAEEAKLRLEAEDKLLAQRAIAGVDYERTRIRAEQSQKALAIQRQRLEQLAKTIDAERAESLARLENRALAVEQAQADVAALLVKAGSSGTVQEVLVVAGAYVAAGAAVARVADANVLRAIVRVPETYASNLAVGQTASVAVLNSDVPAVVARVDPAVTNGSVAVALEFAAALPNGVRPDISVRAAITVAEIDDTLFVRRPVGVFDNRTANVFVIDEAAGTAIRKSVQVGVGSLRDVQILDGLRQGDHIVIDSTTHLGGADVVRLE